MKQEDKELFVKDLCARLPYKVTINVNIEDPVNNIFANFDDALTSIDKIFEKVNDEFVIEEIKLYLFPLSSMTDEQRKEYYEVWRQDWIDNNEKSKDSSIVVVLNKGIDWLNAHHFDYRGLIDKGLAIDCTNLNIY